MIAPTCQATGEPIEVKTPRGRQSARQMEYQDALEAPRVSAPAAADERSQVKFDDPF